MHAKCEPLEAYSKRNTFLKKNEEKNEEKNEIKENKQRKLCDKLGYIKAKRKKTFLLSNSTSVSKNLEKQKKKSLKYISSALFTYFGDKYSVVRVALEHYHLL